MFNPDFNYGEFAIIKSKAGLNNFKISIKEWHEKTNAIGIVARAGRYSGTYAHKDIAFNFCMWISQVFQLYLVRDYQRLIGQEQKRGTYTSLAKTLGLPLSKKLTIEHSEGASAPRHPRQRDFRRKLKQRGRPTRPSGVVGVPLKGDVTK